MKYLFPLFALVAVSGSVFAQTEPAPAPTTDTAKTSVPSTPIFKDVPPNHWAFAAVQRIASAGIVEGYPSTATPTTQTVAKVAPAPVAPALAPKLAPRVPVKTATKAKVAPQVKAAPRAKTPTKKTD